MAGIIIPSPFRKFTDKLREIDVDGNTLAECMETLIGQYPGLNSIHDHPALLSIFINGKLIKDEWNSVLLNDEDEISLIMPIAGG